MKRAVLLALPLLAACATWDDKVNANPQWPEPVKAAIRKGQVTPGMTEEQVAAAWGDSLKDVRATGTESSYSQTNFYENDGPHQGNWGQCPRGRYVVHFELRRQPNGKAELIAKSVGNW